MPEHCKYAGHDNKIFLSIRLPTPPFWSKTADLNIAPSWRQKYYRLFVGWP